MREPALEQVLSHLPMRTERTPQKWIPSGVVTQKQQYHDIVPHIETMPCTSPPLVRRGSKPLTGGLAAVVDASPLDLSVMGKGALVERRQSLSSVPGPDLSVSPAMDVPQATVLADTVLLPEENLMASEKQEVEEEEEEEEEEEDITEAVVPEGEGESTATALTRLQEADFNAFGIRKQARNISGLKAVVNIRYCKYSVIQSCCDIMGWSTVCDDTSRCHILWMDNPVETTRFRMLGQHQKLNRFLGMQYLSRKDVLSYLLNAQGRLFPKHYGFHPQTWILPCDASRLKEVMHVDNESTTYIVKPVGGSQGLGIFLTQRLRQIPWDQEVVVQAYVDKPLLLDGFKWDIRLYVLVISVDPLRIFLYKEGMARFCTARYQAPSASNMDSVFSHLTNYAINKSSCNFMAPEEGSFDLGSKRVLSAVLAQLEASYPGQCRAADLWEKFADIAVKVMLALSNSLYEEYGVGEEGMDEEDPTRCFQILGFDLLLDASFNVHLLEVNHSPSFATESPLDVVLKEGCITDAFDLLQLHPAPKRGQRLHSAAAPRSRKDSVPPPTNAHALHRVGSASLLPSGVMPSGLQLMQQRQGEENECQAAILRLRQRYAAYHQHRCCYESVHAAGNYQLIYPAAEPSAQYEKISLWLAPEIRCFFVLLCGHRNKGQLTAGKFIRMARDAQLVDGIRVTPSVLDRIFKERALVTHASLLQKMMPTVKEKGLAASKSGGLLTKQKQNTGLYMSYDGWCQALMDIASLKYRKNVMEKNVRLLLSKHLGRLCPALLDVAHYLSPSSSSSNGNSKGQPSPQAPHVVPVAGGYAILRDTTLFPSLFPSQDEAMGFLKNCENLGLAAADYAVRQVNRSLHQRSPIGRERVTVIGCGE
jgi:tubulin polyglutamylase TTLL6/13